MLSFSENEGNLSPMASCLLKTDFT